MPFCKVRIRARGSPAEIRREPVIIPGRVRVGPPAREACAERLEHRAIVAGTIMACAVLGVNVPTLVLTDSR